MLASKIEDFSKNSASKRPSKFYLFWHRFFIDFGSILASNMGLLGRQDGSESEKMGPKSWHDGLPRALLIRCSFRTSFMTVLASILGGLGVDFLRFWDDFGRLLAYFGHVFGCSCWGGYAPQTPPLLTWFSLFLVRSSANFAKKIQELAEDKAENPRTCRGQSREQNPYRRLQEKSNLKALFF